MRVIVAQKDSFWQVQFNNVTNITFANNIYTVIDNGTSHSFNKDNYIIFIIN